MCTGVICGTWTVILAPVKKTENYNKFLKYWILQEKHENFTKNPPNYSFNRHRLIKGIWLPMRSMPMTVNIFRLFFYYKMKINKKNLSWQKNLISYFLVIEFVLGINVTNLDDMNAFAARILTTYFGCLPLFINVNFDI